ncbi:MAG: type I methionyl aminopeptidase [Phycisphaerae bacterium]|nr:type I methionyl aminopeptidase [Phycisphaerae bacterium]
MAITLRSSREIELLRKAGAVVAEVLSKLQEAVRPGISTAELDALAGEITDRSGATALFKGVKSPYASIPFPGVICASVNEQVVHGIPSAAVKLREGDIFSVDYGDRLAGYCGDAAVTVAVGRIAPDRQRLMDVTRQLLDIAIERSAPGVKWSEVAGQMERCAKDAGFSVVTDFVGHGIGMEMHEDPKLPNFVSKELMRNDIVLKPGMILAVEPMVNMGKPAVKTLADGWTVVTKDGLCSAHFEHTIAIVASGCEVLTV